MASWKKVVVSGSRAHLNDVTASFFKGDGSALTNIAGTISNNLVADNATIQFNTMVQLKELCLLKTLVLMQMHLPHL